MIQEQISTSSPRCLDGNSGFGVVAQTSGMAPNVSRDVSMLSGYTHFFSAGDVRNPVVFMHVIRRAGGMDRHIVSRVADCGNDYSGRTNRIAHHFIIEEFDLQQLSCGAAAILSEADLFFTQWNDKAHELPARQKLPNPIISVQKCLAWEQFCGDAGWGGVVAERVERGNPVSIIFEPDKKNILPLVAEVFTMLPVNIRWRTTFSTFFMKSQEPPATNKIQIKCIIANSDEMMFARLSPDTLVIDLRKKLTETPVGKYVEIARVGAVKPSPTTPLSVPIRATDKIVTSNNTNSNIDSNATDSQGTENLHNNNKDEINIVTQPVIVPPQQRINIVTKNKNVYDKIWLNAIPAAAVFFVLFLVGGLIFVFYVLAGQDKSDKKIDQPTTTLQHEEIKPNRNTTITETQDTNRKTESEIEQHQEIEIKQIDEKKFEVKKRTEEDEAKAAIEKKQKEEHEQKLQKEKELLAKFANLPDSWDGLGLPLSSGSSVIVLPDSKFLAEIRSRVKISYKPFVNFETESEKSILHIKKTEQTDRIEFWYEEGKDVNGNPIKKNIATIDLKDDGLNFKFGDQLQGHKTDSDSIRRFNRILLAKLNIELKDAAVKKEIALYTPTKMNNIDTKRFTLWGQDGKEYVLSQNGNTAFYFDIRKFCTIQNSKEQVQLANPKKIVPLQSPVGYVHEVIYKGEKGTCQIKPLDQKMFTLELNFLSHSLEKILNKQNELQNQLNEKIKLKNETEKKKKDAEKILTKTRNDYENINSP
ncbi:MAG: cell envelope integrity protein TolA, partial [Planctomycetaceae bacterium]|nr:cell envelope integrity protein TolA [Planctomycetaceae bacterium]